MNLAEEYITVNEGVIILVSGLSGSNRSTLAKDISIGCEGRICFGSVDSSRTILADEIQRDFKLKLISLENYCKKENVKVIEIGELKINDWEHIDVYDWKEFNSDVNKHKKTGVIAYGDYFPTAKLEFKPDFHIHVKLSKETLIEKRKLYIEKNPEKCGNLLDIIKNNQFELIINKITYPYYLEHRDKSTIDKFVNADKNNPDEIYNQVFDYITFSMRKTLNEYYAKHPRAIDDLDTTNETASSISTASSITTDISDDSDDIDEPVEILSTTEITE